MTDTDFDVDDNDLDDNDGTEAATERNPLRAEMRKLAKENKALRATAEANSGAARELAFIKAGIDLAGPGAKSFLKAYDGELTAEAIKAAAVEDGLVAAEETAIPQAEKDAHKRISDPSAGTRPVGARDFDSDIAAAEAKGDHLTAIGLKQARAAQNRAGKA
jgi:hypothetical protein